MNLKSICIKHRAIVDCVFGSRTALTLGYLSNEAEVWTLSCSYI